jgi:hypothetical protein
MDMATELPSRRILSDFLETRLHAGAAECDRCGRTIRRETAVEDGEDEALLCPDCEFGED